ncbi:MAG: hypothetical protein HEP71_24940 [Roseivirga sp.]|nr:hypothetical protein [Roseivirga sp.]
MRITSPAAIYTILIISLYASIALGQQKTYGIPDLQNYGPNDHGSGTQTWDILQDAEGLMYFANRGGVITFDGHYWNTIPMANQNTARSMAMDRNGTIYVGGVGEVGYLAGDSLGGLTYVSLIDKIEEEILPRLTDMWFTACTEEGVFFVGLHDIFHYRNGEFKVFTMDDQNGPINRAWEIDGELYLLRPDSGLWTIKSDSIKLVPGGELVANGSSTASGLIPWNNNELLFISYQGETWAFNEQGGRKEEHPSFDNMRGILSQTFVGKIDVIPGLGYGFSTFDRGSVITDEEFRPLYIIDKKNGLANNAVKEGFYDNAGNYWMATNTGMSLLVLNSPFTYAGERQGIDTNILSAVMKNDTLFLGTAWGVKYESDKGFVQIPNSQLEIWDLDVVEDRLYASAGNWLEELDVKGDRREVERTEPWGLTPLKSRPGWYILHSSHQSLRAIELVNGKLVSNGHIANYVGDARILVEDKQGYIWISNGQNPIVKLKLNEAMDSVIELREVGVAEGLPSDIRSDVIPYDPAGDQGILVINDSSFYTYYAEQDTFLLYEPFLGLAKGFKHNSFVEAPDGTIYTRAGLDKMRFVKTEGGFRVDSLGFGKIRDALIQSIMLGPDSTVLYLSSEGIIQYHPNRVPEAFTNFKTVVSQAISGEEVLSGVHDYAHNFLENGLGLNYQSNSVRFSYSALFFEEAEKNTFRYLLEGYDKEWSSWSTEAYKEYTNLPEGRYTFRVKSKNLYGVEGEEATFEFRVFPPWYRSGLAFGGYGLLSIFFIWMIVRAYTHRLIKEKEKLEQIVIDRTREISEQKDEIAAQADELKKTNKKLVDLGRFKQDMTSMIVHDLKSPLSVIIKTGEKKASAIARKMLNLVLNMLDVQKFEETDVQPSLADHSVNDLVNLAIEDVEDNIAEGNLKLGVEVSDSYVIAMDANLIERVLVNLLTNAIRYAPVNSSLHLQVTRASNDDLYFSLADEGPGISAEKQKIIFDRYAQAEEQVNSRSQSTGLGLTFCKMVIEAHGGKIGVESEVGGGAKFWFTLPGLSCEASAKEILFAADSYILTEEDIVTLNEVLPTLKDLKIYQSTGIENVLKKLPVQEGSGISIFCQKLINASYNGDEESFSRLLAEIEEG